MASYRKTPPNSDLFGYLNRGCSTEDAEFEQGVQFLAAPQSPVDPGDGPDLPPPPPPPPPPERVQWSFEDVSLSTGYCLKGGVVNWTTYDSVEHIAGVAGNDHVIVFSRSVGGPWQTLDVTEITGVKIVSDMAAWLTPNGQGSVEHLAGHTANNELIVFWRSSGADWNSVNVSAKTGTKAVGRMAAWLTDNGPYLVEHLGGRTPDGEVVVFWWSPAHDWQSVNVTAITGKSVCTDLVAWQTRNGPYNVEHLAGANDECSLMVFWWSPAADWQSIDVTSITGVRAASAQAAWQTLSGRYNVEHLACATPENELAVFWWSPLHDWQAINASDISGEGLSGRPAQYRSSSLAAELLVGKDTDGHLTAYWWTPERDWQGLDITRIAGPAIFSDPVGWLAVERAVRKERIAAVGPDGELLIFEGDSTERDETDSVNSPIFGISRKRRVRQKVLTILWDPKKPGIAAPSKQTVENLLFGPTGSVRQYFLENSGDLFTIENAGIYGWYDADYAPSEYWPGNGNVGRDSGAEAIRKASADVNLSGFDLNGDGQLSALDIAILFILPSMGSGGGLNRIVGEDYQSRAQASGITVDGVLIRWIAEVSLGSTPGIVSHELSHLMINLGDMYFNKFINPYAAGEYSLMDNHWNSPHIDPANRLKLGWLKPKLLYRSGRCSLPSVETSGQVLILHDPDWGTGEYFILENRSGDGSFDASLPDTGLGVWHVMENPSTYNSAMPPPGVSQAFWGTLNLMSPDGWPRKGIRMIRPEISGSSEDSALWDGTDPQTGYPLLGEDPDTSHSELKWGDGTPSRFAIRDVSAPGPVIELTVDIAGAPVFSRPVIHRVCSRAKAPDDVVVDPIG